MGHHNQPARHASALYLLSIAMFVKGEIDARLTAAVGYTLADNEALANRASQRLGGRPGDGRVSPLGDANRHQSANDTFPTALRLAAILALRELEQALVELQEAFQALERRFAGVVKPGRTLFELSFPNEEQAREALAKAIQKLPIKARIITREEAI